MSASQIYESHNGELLNEDVAFATAAAIALHSMSFADAKNLQSGQGERVEVKDWSDPVGPKTGAGTANLEKIDSESDTKWFVLGLIPASENINDGVAALGKYHQPVRITGYLVESQNGGSPVGGIWSGPNDVQVSQDCVARTGNQNIAQVYVLVTKIELADNVVSLDGEHEDEYTFGSVPFLGRTGFILFLLVVGAGGAVGAYMYSSLRMRMSARSVALTLLGKEGVEKAAQVRKDVAKAKKEGSYDGPAKPKAESKPKPAPKKSKKNEDDGFGSFSIDSALGSASSSSSRSDFGSGSSVVASDDAKRVEKQIEESEPFVPPTSTFGGGLQSQVQSPLLRLQYHPPTLDHQDQRNPLNLLRSQRFGVVELFESRPSPNLSLKQNQNLSNRRSSGTMKRKNSRTSVSKPKDVLCASENDLILMPLQCCW